MLILNPHVVACDISLECIKYNNYWDYKFHKRKIDTYLEFVFDELTLGSHFFEIFHNKVSNIRRIIAIAFLLFLLIIYARHYAYK